MTKGASADYGTGAPPGDLKLKKAPTQAHTHESAEHDTTSLCCCAMYGCCGHRAHEARTAVGSAVALAQPRALHILTFVIGPKSMFRSPGRCATTQNLAKTRGQKNQRPDLHPVG